MAAASGAMQDMARHRHSDSDSSAKEAGWTDDPVGEVAAKALFRHLDRDGTGCVRESEVLALFPLIAQNLDGGSAAAFAATLQPRNRTAPLQRPEWMALMRAIRDIVGERRFKSSLRKAEAALAERRTGVRLPALGGSASAPRLPVPGAVETTPTGSSLHKGTVMFAPQEEVAPKLQHSASAGKLPRASRRPWGGMTQGDELFDRLDANRDGLVSREELREGIRQGILQPSSRVPLVPAAAAPPPPRVGWQATPPPAAAPAPLAPPPPARKEEAAPPPAEAAPAPLAPPPPPPEQEEAPPPPEDEKAAVPAPEEPSKAEEKATAPPPEEPLEAPPPPPQVEPEHPQELPTALGDCKEAPPAAAPLPDTRDIEGAVSECSAEEPPAQSHLPAQERADRRRPSLELIRRQARELLIAATADGSLVTALSQSAGTEAVSRPSTRPALSVADLIEESDEEKDLRVRAQQLVRDVVGLTTPVTASNAAAPRSLTSVPEEAQWQTQARERLLAASVDGSLLEALSLLAQVNPFSDTTVAEDPALENLRRSVRDVLQEAHTRGYLTTVLQDSTPPAAPALASSPKVAAAGAAGDDDEDEDDEEDDDLVAMRQEARQLLITASRDGSLAQALREQRARADEGVDSDDSDDDLEDLRMQARQTFMQASLSGSLQAAMAKAIQAPQAARKGQQQDDEEDPDVARLRAEARATLIKAGRDGSLHRLLHQQRQGIDEGEGEEEEEGEGEESEEDGADSDSSEDLRTIREQARAVLVSASRDGSLLEALKGGGSKPQQDEEEDEDEDSSVVQLRLQTRQLLINASRDGSLLTALMPKGPATQEDSASSSEGQEDEDFVELTFRELAFREVDQNSFKQALRGSLSSAGVGHRALDQLSIALREGEAGSVVAQLKGPLQALAILEGAQLSSVKVFDCKAEVTRQANAADRLADVERAPQPTTPPPAVALTLPLQLRRVEQAQGSEEEEQAKASFMEGEGEEEDEDVTELRRQAWDTLFTATRNGSLKAVLYDRPESQDGRMVKAVTFDILEEDEDEMADKDSFRREVSDLVQTSSAGSVRSSEPGSAAHHEWEELMDEAEDELDTKLVYYAGRLVMEKLTSPTAAHLPDPVEVEQLNMKRHSVLEVHVPDGPSAVLVPGKEESGIPTLTVWQPDALHLEEPTSPKSPASRTSRASRGSGNEARSATRSPSSGSKDSPATPSTASPHQPPLPPPSTPPPATPPDLPPGAPTQPRHPGGKKGSRWARQEALEAALEAATAKRGEVVVAADSRPGTSGSESTRSGLRRNPDLADLAEEQAFEKRYLQLKREAGRPQTPVGRGRRTNAVGSKRRPAPEPSIFKEDSDDEPMMPVPSWARGDQPAAAFLGLPNFVTSPVSADPWYVPQKEELALNDVVLPEEEADAKATLPAEEEGEEEDLVEDMKGPSREQSPQSQDRLPGIHDRPGSRGTQSSPGSSRARGAQGSPSSTGVLRLPALPGVPSNARGGALSRSQSTPGGFQSSDGGSQEVAELRRRLEQEMADHQKTAEHVKDLERRLRIIAAQAKRRPSPRQTKRFGVASGRPYGQELPPPPKVPEPKHSKAVCLPALRSLPPPPKREDREARAEAEAAALAARRECLHSADRAMPRQSKSVARIEAISRLDSLGLNTWHVRQAEKVARMQDLERFSSAMWDSFFEWKEDSAGVH